MVKTERTSPCCPVGGAGAGNDGGGLVGAGRDGGCDIRLPPPPLGAPLLTDAGAVLRGPVKQKISIKDRLPVYMANLYQVLQMISILFLSGIVNRLRFAYNSS